jgi:hypothetical protein
MKAGEEAFREGPGSHRWSEHGQRCSRLIGGAAGRASNKVLKGVAQGVDGQVGAMPLVVGQAVQGLDEIVSGQRAGLRNGTANDQHRQYRAASNGGPATVGLEASVGKDVITNLKIKNQKRLLVRCASRATAVRQREAASVPRSREMGHQNFRILGHIEKLNNRCSTLDACFLFNSFSCTDLKSTLTQLIGRHPSISGTSSISRAVLYLPIVFPNQLFLLPFFVLSTDH